LQIAALRRVLKATWDREGREMGVDQVAAALIAEADKRIQDIGRQLYAYTREGQYDRLFNGRNSVNLDHRFIVMELNGLKGRQDLQQVVLLQLMYQIQQVMYQQDEEIDLPSWWSSTKLGTVVQGQIGLFIENGYRRFRKRNGAAVIITQGIDDIYRSESGQAIISKCSLSAGRPMSGGRRPTDQVSERRYHLQTRYPILRYSKTRGHVCDRSS